MRRHPLLHLLEEPLEAQSLPMITPSFVHFKPEEPQTLDAYVGQLHIKKTLQIALGALEPTNVLLRHRLLTGLPGFGKTLLAKILAKALQDRAQVMGLGTVGFVETYGANLNSVEAMDQAVAQTQQYSAAVWFIDEIHVLNRELATKLYLLLEEQRYPFNGSANPTALKPLMVIGATTDYGNLHPALKRRFGEPLMMQGLNLVELMELARGLLPQATEAALRLLASRCVHSGAPYELKLLADSMREYAIFSGVSQIDTHHVQEMFEVWQIDELGLRPTDRRVIHAMLDRPRHRGRDGAFLGYGGSEADICAVAGIDRAEFQQVVRPKLLSRRLLEVRPGIGLVLTEKAVLAYHTLEPST
jgi:Holliday junction DNA helicase RuvB